MCRSPSNVDRVSRTLLVALLGAQFAKRCNTPLPWMLRSMASTSLVAVLGVEVYVPKWMKQSMQAVIGTQLGCQFRPNILLTIYKSAGSAVGLLLLTSLGTLVGSVYLQRVAHYDVLTSIFAAAPGGLNDMLILGSELGGDEKAISLTHICRLLCVMAVLPMMLHAFGLVSVGSQSDFLQTQIPVGAPLSASLPPREICALLTCILLGPTLAYGLPARFMLGPLFLSAGLHVLGLAAGEAPRWLICFAQSVLGAATGAQLASSGASPKEMGSAVLVGLGATTLLLLLALAATSVVQKMLSCDTVPLPLLLLAYSPGGMTEMCLLASGQGYDVAFVAAHHILRIMSLLTCLPAVARAQIMRSEKGRRVQRISSSSSSSSSGGVINVVSFV